MPFLSVDTMPFHGLYAPLPQFPERAHTFLGSFLYRIRAAGDCAPPPSWCSSSSLLQPSLFLFRVPLLRARIVCVMCRAPHGGYMRQLTVDWPTRIPYPQRIRDVLGPSCLCAPDYGSRTLHRVSIFRSLTLLCPPLASMSTLRSSSPTAGCAVLRGVGWGRVGSCPREEVGGVGEMAGWRADSLLRCRCGWYPPRTGVFFRCVLLRLCLCLSVCLCARVCVCVGRWTCGAAAFLFFSVCVCVCTTSKERGGGRGEKVSFLSFKRQRRE